MLNVLYVPLAPAIRKLASVEATCAALVALSIRSAALRPTARISVTFQWLL